MASGTFTIKPSGGHYTSLSAWEAAQQSDLTGTGPCIAECYSMDDTTVVVIDGWTTTAADYIKIYTPTSERHNGKWDASKYKLGVGAYTTGIGVSEQYVRLEGLQIYPQSIYSRRAIYSEWLSGASNIHIEACVINSTVDNGFGGIGFSNNGATINIFNCAIYRTTVGGTGITHSGSSGVVNVYNCTLVNFTTGIDEVSGTINAYNCGASNCTTGFSAGVTQTTCSTTTPTFVDGANYDYHLASSDTTWKDAGTSDPGAGLFSTDIDGQTRSGTWDIGADEYVAAGGGLSIPIAMYHYQHHIGSGV